MVTRRTHGTNATKETMVTSSSLTLGKAPSSHFKTCVKTNHFYTSKGIIKKRVYSILVELLYDSDFFSSSMTVCYYRYFLRFRILVAKSHHSNHLISDGDEETYILDN